MDNSNESPSSTPAETPREPSAQQLFQEKLLEFFLKLGITLQSRPNCDQPSLVVSQDQLLQVLALLKNDPQFEFDMLMDHCAIDWMAQGQIELVYQLFSSRHKNQLRVSLNISRTDAHAPSVNQLWPIALWQEREVYDLFGVIYTGHPDLRRLFLEDDWQGFPLLKDYKDEFMLERPW